MLTCFSIVYDKMIANDLREYFGKANCRNNWQTESTQSETEFIKIKTNKKKIMKSIR